MKELLFSVTKKDLEITYFSGSGAGGQYRNKHKNCVRIKHPETGVIATGQSQRSLKQNMKNAFKGLCNNKTFKTWLRVKSCEMMYGKSEIEIMVEDSMKPKNLKIEMVQGEVA